MWLECSMIYKKLKLVDVTVELLMLAIRTPVKKYLTSYVAISHASVNEH